MRKLVSIIVLFISYNVIYPQSIIHPNKFGFGYHLGISSIENTSFLSHNIYISTGKVDFMFSYSKSTNFMNKEATSLGLSYTYIKENAKFYPTIGISYMSSAHKEYAGIGVSLAVEWVHFNSFRILPEAGISFLYSLPGNDNGTYYYNSYNNNSNNNSSNTAGYVGANFCLGGRYIVLTVAPGIHFASKAKEYSITIGLSFMP